MGTSVAAVNRQLEGFGRTARAAFAAIGIGVGLRELVQLTRGALDAAGGLGELAEQMGITTRTLQVLQYAATQFGIRQGDVETSIQRFSRSIGEAAEGTKLYIDTFEQLGVKILDAGGNLRPTEVLLREVAQAIAALDDPARRAAAAADLFGRGGQKLLPILSQGAAGFDDMARAAEDAGVILSDEMIAIADQAADEIAALEFQLSKWWQSLVIAGVPAIREFLSAFEDLSNAIAGAVGDALGLPRNSVEGELERLRNNLAIQEEHRRLGLSPVTDAQIEETRRRIRELELIQQLDREAAEMGVPAGGGPLNIDITPGGVSNPEPTRPIGGGRGKSPADVIRDLQFQLEQLGRSQLEREIFANLQRAGVDFASATGQAIAALTTEIHRMELAQRAADEAFRRAADAAAEQDREREAAAERARELLVQRDTLMANLGRELQDRQKLIAALREGGEAYAVEARYQEMANQFRALGMPLYGQEAEQVRALARAFIELDRETARVQAAQQELEGFFDRSFDRIGSAVTEAFAAGQGAAIDFEDVVLAVLSEIEQEMFRLAVINPLKNLFGGNEPELGDVFGGLFGGGRLGRDVGNMIALNPGIFHAGGIVGAGGVPSRRVPAALFAGAPRLHDGLLPDEFPAILQRGEAVLPAGMIDAIGGGPEVDVNVTVINQNPTAGIEARRRPGGEIEIMVTTIVERDFNTNGRISRAAARAFGQVRAPGVAR